MTADRVGAIGASSPAPGAAPAADLVMAEPLVRALLLEQHPDLATLPLVRTASGWDNEMFRLGDDLCVRLPRRALAAPSIFIEQRWLPQLAPSLPLPVPAVRRVGRPSAAYPWPWSVIPWLVGVPADLCELGVAQELVLADFLRALHRSAPADAPRNPSRGGALQSRLVPIAPRIARLRSQGLFDDALGRCLDEALRASIDVEPTWIHGDLHPRNVLVRDGSLSAVIDWGDMAAGDRATDLASLWMLLSDGTRRAKALRHYGPVSSDTVARARGWAILFGALLADAGRGGDARFQAIGERTLRRVAEGP